MCSLSRRSAVHQARAVGLAPGRTRRAPLRFVASPSSFKYLHLPWCRVRFQPGGAIRSKTYGELIDSIRSVCSEFVRLVQRTRWRRCLRAAFRCSRAQSCVPNSPERYPHSHPRSHCCIGPDSSEAGYSRAGTSHLDRDSVDRAWDSRSGKKAAPPRELTRLSGQRWQLPSCPLPPGLALTPEDVTRACTPPPTSPPGVGRLVVLALDRVRVDRRGSAATSLTQEAQHLDV
jgi:hypothetical protein